MQVDVAEPVREDEVDRTFSDHLVLIEKMSHCRARLSIPLGARQANVPTGGIGFTHITS